MMKHNGCNGFWLGVDLAEETLDASVAPGGMNPMDWKELAQEHFENSRKGLKKMIAWTRRRVGRDGHLEGVCVESTGRISRRFADGLEALDDAWPIVSIVNPKRPLDFARSLGVREKTDPIDAAVLAAYAAVNRPKPTPAPAAGYRCLRELSRTRQTLVNQRTALANNLRDQDDAFSRKTLKHAAANLDKSIAQIEDEAWRLIREDANLRRDFDLLQSIKGIGKIVAWTLMAELGDLRQYRRSQIVARVGIFPGKYESGKSVRRKPRWVKGGGAPVRKALFNAARSILNSKDNTLKTYADRLAEDGKKPMECIAALMRKILLIARSVLIQEIPYDPMHQQKN